MKINNIHLLCILLIIILGAILFPTRELLTVRRRNIPAGNEDLYVLKSEIVPPVCPKCPDSKTCPRKEKCPPCPPCERCPEPAFTCKKVPDYTMVDNIDTSTPLARLNTFSKF